jgi:cytochrome P450
VLLSALLHHPEQLAAVREDRSLIPQSIEEALRWDGPVLMQSRYASKAVTLGSVDIAEGAFIDVIAGSANRDETKFPEPDKFDIFRKPQHRHFAFAFGPHVCIGQHLARVEMTRALNAILDLLPNLRLDPDKPAPQTRGTMMRVPHSIHVKFG